MSEPVQSLVRANQDAVLLEIYALAHKHAAEWIPEQKRDDIVHDLALECLEQLRSGTWTTPELGLDRYIELRILDRCVKKRRSRRRDERRDARFLAAITDVPREWMSQELKSEEDRLRAFAADVRKTLKKSEVRTHLMVRDDNMSYATVAKKLRLSRARIHSRMKTVHQAFRDALPTIGIDPPPAGRGGRPKRRSRRKSRSRRPSASTSQR